MPEIKEIEKEDKKQDNFHEVALHELGEALAISSVSISRELQRYPNEMGSFIVEDLEIDIPVQLRIDRLGQVMARAVSKIENNDAVARIRLRVKPSEKQINTHPVIADVPLSAIESFSVDELKAMAEYRIFSVEDFIRICRNTSGRIQLEKLVTPNSIKSAMKPAELLTLSGIPKRVLENLIKHKIQSISDFLNKDDDDLINLLKTDGISDIDIKEVHKWKELTNQYIIKSNKF